MRLSLKEEKVFKDPVHKYIYVQDQPIWDLINTREFQRLRRIRQLGTSFFTFHGAEHSRFSHSLGVYEIARKILSQFGRLELGDWPREERLLCLCAALLHDVGHGPFSHSMEAVFGVRHEHWSCRVVEEDTEIHRVLEGVAPDFSSKVARIIDKTSSNPMLVDLIASQMDADRMDYLLRDAYYTGVNYGTFDLDRLLRVLRPYRGRIVTKESGMHTVEDYLMSRYQMYWQVYFHPVTRSSEILLRNILKRAKHLHAGGFAFRFLPWPLPELFAGELSVPGFLRLDESFMQMTLMQWMDEDDSILQDLCDRFLNRRLFKYVGLAEGETALYGEVCEAVSRSGGEPEYFVAVDLAGDLPHDVYRPKETGGVTPIYLLSERGELTEISTRSEIIRTLSGRHQGMRHLYYPADMPGFAERAGADLRRKLRMN